MSLLRKMFTKREDVIKCIAENGMSSAVEQYGLDKLLNLNILFQYEDTDLYHDEFISYQRVYNSKGEFLGNITDLMAPFYKKLGYFWGPCMNGNIILSQSDKEKGYKTYAVFDKHAEVLIGYGSYCNKVFLPNGVALLASSEEENIEVITINPEGQVKRQPFTHIEESHTTKGNERTFTVKFPNEDGPEQLIKGNDDMLW